MLCRLCWRLDRGNSADKPLLRACQPGWLLRSDRQYGTDGLRCRALFPACIQVGKRLSEVPRRHVRGQRGHRELPPMCSRQLPADRRADDVRELHAWLRLRRGRNGAAALRGGLLWRRHGAEQRQSVHSVPSRLILQHGRTGAHAVRTWHLYRG